MELIEQICNSECLIKAIKLLLGIGTPIITAIIGIILLRRVEGIKNEVSKSYEFKKKWADDFYLVCKDFMEATEKYLAIVSQFRNINDNGEFSIQLQKELTALNIKIPEIERRIRRFSELAPKNKEKLNNKSNEIQNYLVEFNKALRGEREKGKEILNFDIAFNMLSEFNTLVMNAHNEMLK